MTGDRSFSQMADEVRQVADSWVGDLTHEECMAAGIFAAACDDLQRAVNETVAGEQYEPSHNYLTVERCPQTLGDAMRLIGRYTESEGGNSAETRQARTDLFDAYETWCHLDRPETEAPTLTDEQRARFEAAAERGLAARFSAEETPEGEAAP